MQNNNPKKEGMPAEAKPKMPAVKKPSKGGQKVAIVRIRGTLNITQDISDTMDMLRLYKKNICVVYDRTDSIMGMVKKMQGYITWGEISEEVYKELVQKRAEEFKGDDEKFFEFEKKKYKKYIRLQPPKKGYGRNGTKAPFTKGGALGYRAEKINDLLKRMM